MKKKFKPALQKMRKRAGYKSAEEYAEHIGIPYGTYRNYEQGDRKLTIETAWELADDLGCTLDELAGREWPVERTWSDDGQRVLNDSYERLDTGARGRAVDMLVDMASNPANLIAKSGQGAEDEVGLMAG